MNTRTTSRPTLQRGMRVRAKVSAGPEMVWREGIVEHIGATMFRMRTDDGFTGWCWRHKDWEALS